MKLPSPSLLVLILLTASLLPTSRAWVDCGDAPPSPSPSPASSPSPSVTPFRANLLALLAALPRAAAPTGFASLSLGAGPDRVFVRGLCRGDMAPPRCQADMEQAVRTLGGGCPAGTRRAAGWFEVYITYADTNASTPREESFRQVVYDARTVADPAAYNQAYGALMRRLAARAAGGGGAVEAGRPFFATGQARYASGANGTMYGLVQCMPDRTAAECAGCLQDSVPQLPGCCSGHQGGVVLGYNCHLRVQIYTYYDLALDAPLPSPPAGPPDPAPPPPPPAGGTSGTGRSRRRNVTLAVALTLGTALLLAAVLIVVVYLRRRRSTQENDKRGRRGARDEDSAYYVYPEKFTLPVLRAATGNFAPENKLGEGGFGQVFKGRLEDGQAIAVKRLFKGSLQGFQELKNELTLAAKLKHRNLVQLLGVCLEATEKLIVYEYLPNRSLDTCLFDAGRRRRRQALDWSKRHAIIRGIARGLLYLHEESRLRIIHRDLKPSNVLLDADMCPKISDFGLARAFWADESRKVTRRPAGTLGYMAPEYAYYGHVSTKSDMFSFGVIVLEILTGRRNTSPSAEEDGSAGGQNLLGYVWEQWRRGSVADAVDASLGGRYARAEALACAQVGLLCVQEDPRSRPGAAAVVLMLDGQSAIQQRPSRPAFVCGGCVASSSRGNGVRGGDPVSENGMTVSELAPR